MRSTILFWLAVVVVAMGAHSIAANPLDEARYRMGAVLMRSHGNAELAADIYRQGRKAIGREDLFATELAQLAEGRGDYETAIAEYLLLVMDPDQSARARRKIQRLLERATDPEDVLAQIEKLRDRHPKSAALHDVAAIALLQAGRREDAFAAVKLADRYAEDQGEHLLEMGRLALEQDEAAPVDRRRTRLGVASSRRGSKETQRVRECGHDLVRSSPHSCRG